MSIWPDAVPRCRSMRRLSGPSVARPGTTRPLRCARSWASRISRRMCRRQRRASRKSTTPSPDLFQADRIDRMGYRCAPDRGQGGAPPRSLLRLRQKRMCSVRTFLILAAGRRSALALGRTRTICRAPAVKPDPLSVSDRPHLPDLRPLRARSRASALLRLRQKRACVPRGRF